VGGAPEPDDVISGVPFSGAHGRVLNQALRAANIDRAECLVTMLYDTLDEPDETCTQAALDRLSAVLTKHRPTVIVPLGEAALGALTGRTAINAFRGAVSLSRRTVDGYKMVPTYGPDKVMANWKTLPVMIGDLIKADKEAAKGPQIVYPERTLYLEPGLADVEWWAQECLRSDLLSVDIETGWGQITTVGLAPDHLRAMSVPFLDLRKPNRNYWPTAAMEVEVWEVLREVLESDVPKLGQNFTYDFAWLLRKHGINVRNYRHDTRLMHHNLYPELPKSLEFMGATYTDLGPWKLWVGRYAKDKRDA
jgi:uracil-DNA glycosylase family 4